MSFLITTFFICLSAWALELEPNSLILTHTSRHYQTHPETIHATEIEIQKASNVIALAQHPIMSDSDWYGYPLSKINHEFYSHAGEHTLSFPKTSLEKKFKVTAVGGYFSACLGKTLSTLVSTFIKDSGSLQELTIELPMSAIFTGFIERDNQLIPKTPYLESILDSSMDGLNLSSTFKLVPQNDLQRFIKESIEIAIFNKSPMINVTESDFRLEALLGGKTVYQKGHGPKKIILLFRN